MNVALWQQRFEEHLQVRGRSPRTQETYLSVLRQFLQFSLDRGLEEVHQIRRQDVDAYRVHLHHCRKSNGEPLSLNTQSHKLTAVLSFLRFLHQEQYVLVNPGHGISGPKVPRRLPPELPDEEQVLQLLEAPDTTTALGLRDRAAIEVLYSSALRNSELCDLRCQDVDLSRLELRILNGKGGKARVLPLGEPAGAWVEEYLANGRPWLIRKPVPWLLVGWRGKQLGREDLTKLVRRNAEKAGLPRITPHLLRHCCATHMLRNRAGLRHLQTLLGHSSAETTQRYTRVEITDLREVHQRCHPRERF